MNSGLVLDVPGSSSAENLQLIQYTCFKTANQQWVLEYIGGGKYFKIRNVYTGKFLSLDSSNYLVQASNDGIATAGSSAQIWSIEGRSYKIKQQ